MGASARITLLLLSWALAGCATAPSPQLLDARALCKQQGPRLCPGGAQSAARGARPGTRYPPATTGIAF
jgi:hypothetical protein